MDKMKKEALIKKIKDDIKSGLIAGLIAGWILFLFSDDIVAGIAGVSTIFAISLLFNAKNVVRELKK